SLQRGRSESCHRREALGPGAPASPSGLHSSRRRPTSEGRENPPATANVRMPLSRLLALPRSYPFRRRSRAANAPPRRPTNAFHSRRLLQARGPCRLSSAPPHVLPLGAGLLRALAPHLAS